MATTGTSVHPTLCIPCSTPDNSPPPPTDTTTMLGFSGSCSADSWITEATPSLQSKGTLWLVCKGLWSKSAEKGGSDFKEILYDLLCRVPIICSLKCNFWSKLRPSNTATRSNKRLRTLKFLRMLNTIWFIININRNCSYQISGWLNGGIYA